MAKGLRQALYSVLLTAVNSDILAGTEMEFAPGDGVYIMKMASSVATATGKLGGNQHPPVNAVLRYVQLRANSEIRGDDQAWVAPCLKGEKMTAEAGGTTGNLAVQVSYVGKA